MSQHALDGTFLFASSKSLDLFGQSPQSLVGTSLLNLAYDADRAALIAAWEALEQQETPQRLRFRIVHHDKPTYVETTARRLVSGEGAGTIVCLTRIIDDVIQAELGWTHWRQLVAQIPGIVWHAPILPDGTRGPADFISDYLERVVGYTAHEWLTTPNFWASIIHPDDLQRTLEATARALAEGIPAPPYRVRAKHGATIYFQSYMRVYRNSAGIPERLYGLTLDVTKFKEAEEANASLLQQLIALSAPVIPVHKDVIVVPLMSVLDAARAERLLVSLLDGVSQKNAKVAIVDLTGISAVDAHGAEGLVQAARAVQLLGTRVILTGLSAEVAKCMIELGLSLEGLPTRATLARALDEIRFLQR